MENHDLSQKVISLIERTSFDFIFLVGKDVIRNVDEKEWTFSEKFHSEGGVNDNVERFALVVVIKSDYSNLNKEKIKSVFDSALKSFVVHRNMAVSYIEEKNFASAIEHLVGMSEALGCLKAEKALRAIKSYIDQEHLTKSRSAKTRYPDRKTVNDIIFECAKSKAKDYKNIDDLLEAIEPICRSEIEKKFPGKGVPWKFENFPRVVSNRRGENPGFDEKLKGLYKK